VRLIFGSGVAAMTVQPPPPPPSTGLASLDVDLPQSGQVYRFTTPRGEVEINAWAISKRLSDRIRGLLLVLSTLVVAVIGIGLVRWHFCSVLVGPSGSTHLIWIGLLMACLGIFPAVGILAFMAGVAAKLARWIGRLANGQRTEGRAFESLNRVA
jgi:hypothetical protein